MVVGMADADLHNVDSANFCMNMNCALDAHADIQKATTQHRRPETRGMADRLKTAAVTSSVEPTKCGLLRCRQHDPMNSEDAETRT